MTEVKHAGGLVSSSKVPALHLIPTEALLCLADRFEVGTKRKGDGAWNALTKNQECLDDNAFLIERCSHIIRHTMMLRDQLAHGYSSEDEDTPYENAGAIIFGGALMACAMARRGECITCGRCFTESGQVACRDCLAYAYEAIGCPVEAAPEPVESPDDWVELPPEHVFRRGVDQFSIGQGYNLSWVDVEGFAGDKVSDYPGDKARCRRKDLPAPQPVESPDDWVVQDRVRARSTDRGAWVDEGEPYPPYDFSSRHWWTVGTGKALGWNPGDTDAVGRTLHLICRRKDLPEVVDPNNPPMPASPEPEDEWVSLDNYPDHVLRKGIDQVRCGSPMWVEVAILEGKAIRTLNGEFRCRREDLPYPIPPWDGYVVQDKVDPRVGIDEFRWVGDGYSQPWKPVESSHVLGGRHGFFDESDGTTLEVRCPKKDLPEIETPPVQSTIFPLMAGNFYACNNGKVAGPMEYNRNQNYFFTKDTHEVGWNHIGQAVRISLDMTDAELKGWNITGQKVG